MRVYQDDIIYNQKDKSEEIFFVLKGWVWLYVDLAQHEGDNSIYAGFN